MAEYLTSHMIRELLQGRADLLGRRAFEVMKALAQAIEDGEMKEERQDLLLRALERREALGPASLILDGLLREIGLFPYLEPDALGIADFLAYEVHRPLNADFVLHRIQAEAYNLLLSGDNVILSAPTSFGKSLIIDAVIASEKFDHIAVVVPTIALIDETRKRLAAWSHRYKIITHPTQKRAARTLLVMTQERILELDSVEPLDLFVIDEFYKLNPRKEDSDRSFLLNEVFYKLARTGAQFYLLGPNIEAIPDLPQRLRAHFIRTDFKTVASDIKIVRYPKKGEVAKLVSLCRSLSDPTLVYCSSPSRVNQVAEALLEDSLFGETRESTLAQAVAWLGSEYHPRWTFVRALSNQIGLHHGKLPRALSQFVVDAFDRGWLRLLICTSTLIEGVNTKAKNVIIFDNKVARKKFDFFTFNNIKGRSGRMFQHFVGRVYLFHEPPDEQLPLIDFPALTQPDSAPDSLLIQIDEPDLRPALRERVARYRRNDYLSFEVLRMNHGIDPEHQIALAKEIVGDLEASWQRLYWTFTPTYQQLKFLCSLMWRHFLRGSQSVKSSDQLAYLLNRLRVVRGPKAFIQERVSTEPGNAVEEALDFLRTWAQFQFPRYATAVDRIQHEIFSRYRMQPGNYGHFIGEVQSLFLHPLVVTLDEYGLPLSVGRTLVEAWKLPDDLDVALDAIRSRRGELALLGLSPFERWIAENTFRTF